MLTMSFSKDYYPFFSPKFFKPIFIPTNNLIEFLKVFSRKPSFCF